MLTAAATKPWRPRSTVSPDAAGEMARATGLPLPFCSLLASRGHASVEGARAFLKPRLDDLLDPFLLRDMDRAVERIRTAIRAGETILVHGDYDVDGVCSAALFTRVLRRLGARVEPFVPNRFLHGYDLGDGGLDAAAKAGATLLLTGDCGVLAHDAIERARGAGIDVVVTDHHRPGPTLPAAVAVVNPNRSDCGYPERSLSGTGVAFKVCEALWEAAGQPREELLWHLDLVALATVADLVPLTGENRILTRYGLRVLRETRNPGLRALMAAASLDPSAVDAGAVGHVIGPRINAAGRVRDARWALGLLLTDDEARAARGAQALEEHNRERRDIDRRTLGQALDQLERSGFDESRDYAVVLAGADWHPGVIGIVASRIVERIHRPTVLIALRAGEAARGSGRSIRPFDLVGGLAACAPLLDRFGGHRAAAGLDIQPDRIDEFRMALNDHAREALGDADLRPDVTVDVALPIADATPEFADLLRHVGPFGSGNPTPVFVARGVRVAAPPRTMGPDGEHARLVLGDAADDAARLPAVAFRMGARLSEPGACDGPLDVAYQLRHDTWRGERRLEARIVDFRPAREAHAPVAARHPA